MGDSGSSAVKPNRRLAALDGLRAVAVIAVLAFHAGVPWVRGGFLGVDAFFVLSGYLITTLLLDEWEHRGRIDLRRFWSRRARRLLPALGLLLVGIAGYAVAFAPADTVAALRLDAVAAAGYVANWRFAAAGGSYFDHAALSSPLRHTWSLAVEEQFYLVWPLVCLLALRGWPSWRRTGGARRSVGRVRLGGAAAAQRRVGALAAAGAVASAGVMAVSYRPGADPTALYYRTDTRAQAVLIGAALAALLARRTPSALGEGPGTGGRREGTGAFRRRILGAGGWISLAVTLAAWGTLDGRAPVLYRGGFGVVALAAAVVVAAAVRLPGGRLAQTLAWAPLAAVGRVSYGIYLWHWPVFLALTAGRTGLTGPGLVAARVVVTAAFAAASYHLVEMPIRYGTGHVSRPWARAAVPSGGVAVIASEGSPNDVLSRCSPGGRSWRGPAALTGAAAATLALVVGATAVPGRFRGTGPTAAVSGGLVDAAGSASRLAATAAVAGPGAGGGQGDDTARPGDDTARPGDDTPRPGDDTARTSPAGAPRPSRRAGGPPPVRSAAQIPAGPAGAARKVLIVGDSVALTLGYGFPAAARPFGADVTDAAVLGCGVVRGGPYRYFGSTLPALSRCENWEQRWASLLDTVQPDVVAVLVGRWEVMDRVHDGRWTHIGDPAFDAYLDGELDTAVRLLASRGATVALLTSPVSKRGERPDGGRWPEDDPARVARWNDILRNVAARSPGVRVVDFGDRLTPGGRLVRVIDGVTVRSSDGVHLTPEGGRWIAPWLAPQLVAAAPPVRPGGHR